MENKLQRLHSLLLENGYTQYAQRLGAILEEYIGKGGLSEQTGREIRALCSVKSLGDLYIREYDNVYDWWDFLSEVVSEIIDTDTGERAEVQEEGKAELI